MSLRRVRALDPDGREAHSAGLASEGRLSGRPFFVACQVRRFHVLSRSARQKAPLSGARFLPRPVPFWAGSFLPFVWRLGGPSVVEGTIRATIAFVYWRAFYLPPAQARRYSPAAPCAVGLFFARLRQSEHSSGRSCLIVFGAPACLPSPGRANLPRARSSSPRLRGAFFVGL